MSRQIIILFLIFKLCLHVSATDSEVENCMSPEDLEIILGYYKKNPRAIYNDADTDHILKQKPLWNSVECFSIGFGSILSAIIEMFSINLEPDSSSEVNTHYYFSSRNMKSRVQVFRNQTKFDTKVVDFNPKRKTVVIVHGFMSHSGADWVTNMTKAYLESEDVNVIAVDWSGGSRTFKYWRAVANTRLVGSDIASFMGQLKKETGLNIKNCHFIGHSLGAHIVSFASQELGKVGRITGLDPAFWCFDTVNSKERLDPNDADFVDVIHTNVNVFGFSEPTGDVDFYPNGGINQPGCSVSKIPVYNIILQAICSHGRAYRLFTESIINKNCQFMGSPWNLTVAGLKASVELSCRNGSLCPTMGIQAATNWKGSYLVITEEKLPYCVKDWDRHHSLSGIIKAIIAYLQSLADTTGNAASTLSSLFSFKSCWTLGITIGLLVAHIIISRVF